MLETEELRDSTRELPLDRRQDPIGIHDAPDRLDKQKALLAGEALRHEPGELIEIDTFLARFLRETQDLPHILLRDTQIFARMTADPLALLGGECRVGVRDLEQEGARRDRDRVGADTLCAWLREERSKSLQDHGASLAGIGKVERERPFGKPLSRPMRNGRLELHMNRRELETFFLTLESTPALLARAAAELPEDSVRHRGTTGGFSLVEHVWHLADLEREAYAVRIRRLLTEDEPQLSNFDGDRAARERLYQRLDLAEGLLAFTLARTRNLQKLRELSADDWRRAGEQEGVGRIELSDVPRMMTEHDRMHGVEIADLVREIRDRIVPPAPLERQLSAFA